MDNYIVCPGCSNSSLSTTKLGFKCNACQLNFRETDTKPINDNIDHPKHYNAGKIEVIDAIEDWKLNYHLGNVVKYIARSDYKSKKLEDLKKAQWYLNREIRRLEKDEKRNNNL